MFSFHKPKIYRSNLGCCICKAKSSSSRFTDSKKYENEFERCFRIQDKRSGEICNACVLLVKRWKKLSPENRLIKHWHHVVDARAGPGTKLTGNRRLTVQHGGNGSSSNSTESGDRSSPSLTNQPSMVCSSQQHQQQHQQMPLSSSQANNTSTMTGGQHSKRSNSFSNKARAIDVNVSTFTFGEPPYRRSYMTPESFSTSNPSSLNKPQSALNSSAFESVIKRFRQRQQQQLLEAQRRQMNRLSRQMKRTSPMEGTQTTGNKRNLANDTCEKNSKPTLPVDSIKPTVVHQSSGSGGKRCKRNSESNIGSMTVDGLRVTSFLDGSMWRKERVCCGIIFRGLYNEVAVFPKLLKPCQGRLKSMKCCGLESDNNTRANSNIQQPADEEDEEMAIDSSPPPPRATKSGSISSCDSNTSGTGSMEQPSSSESTTSSSGIGTQSSRTASSSSIGTSNSSRQRRKSALRPLAARDDEDDDDDDDDYAEREAPIVSPVTPATKLSARARAAGPQSGPIKSINRDQQQQQVGRQRRSMAKGSKRSAATDSDSIISSSDSSSAGFQSASSPSQAILMDEDEAEMVDEDGNGVEDDEESMYLIDNCN